MSVNGHVNVVSSIDGCFYDAQQTRNLFNTLDTLVPGRIARMKLSINYLLTRLHIV